MCLLFDAFICLYGSWWQDQLKWCESRYLFLGIDNKIKLSVVSLDTHARYSCVGVDGKINLSVVGLDTWFLFRRIGLGAESLGCMLVCIFLDMVFWEIR